MKCPGCKFVLSDANDICTQCLLDLRSYKEEIGLAITHPDLDYQEVINIKFGSRKKKKKKNKVPSDDSPASKKKTKGIVQSLFDRVFSSSKSSEGKIDDTSVSPSEQVYDILTEAHNEGGLITEGGGPISENEQSIEQEVHPVTEPPPVPAEPSIVAQKAPQEDTSKKPVEAISVTDRVTAIPREATPIITETSTEMPALPEDKSNTKEILEPITEIPEPVLASTVKEPGKQAEPVEEPVPVLVPQNKAAPAVQEFTDDSDDFDEYLNSILGDTEIQIEAVKTKPIDYGIKKDQDVPFEFEVEFEDDDDEEDDDEYGDYEP